MMCGVRLCGINFIYDIVHDSMGSCSTRNTAIPSFCGLDITHAA